nr:bifunctional biotin--[acetyl-CoA-carboxylase] synthetase/biotin operon repressor [Streptococcus thermophilus]
MPLNFLGAVVMLRALPRCPDTLDPMTVQDIARIESEVAEHWSEVRHVEESTSTNTEQLATGEPGQVLIADRQTGGKGRLGRVWEAPAGASLLMSVAVELKAFQRRRTRIAGNGFGGDRRDPERPAQVAQ